MARARRPRTPAPRALDGISAVDRSRTLEQIFRILCEFGFELGASRRDLRREFATALLASSRRPYRMSEARGFDLWHQAGELLAAWYGQPALVDDTGQPRPLPLDGSLSVESLVRDYLPEHSPAAVIEVLLDEKILVRLPNGLCRPVRRSAFIPRMNGMTMDRIAVLLRGLLATIVWNHSGRRGPLRMERQAHASHLPIDKIPEFEAMVKQLATLLADQVDVWMSSRQAAGSRKTRTARVGVHLFSYLERNDTVARPRAKRERRA